VKTRNLSLMSRNIGRIIRPERWRVCFQCRPHSVPEKVVTTLPSPLRPIPLLQVVQFERPELAGVVVAPAV
jgi:hypothetical protein